jgi:protein LTV1
LGRIDKALHLADLENELDFESMRDNEGEAAEYGIYFDDTTYDYMQHLRDIGEGGGEAHFLEAASVKVKGKGKAKMMKLEDALPLSVRVKICPHSRDLLSH